MKYSLSAAISLIFLATTAHGADLTLPWPVTNNAVAVADGTLYSFLGLGPGKAWRDVGRYAAGCSLRDGHCTALPDVPLPNGRIAATAVPLGGKVYLFGGYSIAEDGEEVSNPETMIWDPKTASWRAGAPIPVPVDDSASFAYEDRFVYLVSGWHDDRNVARVQVYDSQKDRWFEATSFPGTPVFGHAGGIAGNRMVVADGVAILGKKPDGHNLYGLVDEAWEGVIDPANPAQVAWKRLPAHPGRPAYRMAAAGAGNRVLFAGGSENPYNYDGQGYDGHPSTPSPRLFGYDFAAGKWIEYPDKKLASMDHRGMVATEGKLYILGGMTADQQVTGKVQVLDLP